MQETFKTLRTIQLSVVVLSLVLFFFASPDIPKSSVELALSEVRALRQLNMDQYLLFVYEKSALERYQSCQQALRSVKLRYDATILFPMIAKVPGKDSTINEIFEFLGSQPQLAVVWPRKEGWLQIEATTKEIVSRGIRMGKEFVPSRMAFIAFVLDAAIPHRIIPIETSYVQSASANFVATPELGIFVIESESLLRHPIVDPRTKIKLPFDPEFLSSPPAQFQVGVHFTNSESLVGPVEANLGTISGFSANVPCCLLSPPLGLPTPTDWIRTKFRNSTIISPAEGRILPGLTLLREQLGSMTMSGAQQWLHGRLDAGPRTVSFEGVAVDETRLQYAGPLALICVLAVFFLYLHRLEEIPITNKDIKDSPWLGIGQDNYVVLFNLITLAVFPTLSCIVTVIRPQIVNAQAVVGAAETLIVAWLGCTLARRSRLIAVNSSKPIVDNEDNIASPS
jgi:hypothetical protein